MSYWEEKRALILSRQMGIKIDKTVLGEIIPTGKFVLGNDYEYDEEIAYHVRVVDGDGLPHYLRSEATLDKSKARVFDSSMWVDLYEAFLLIYLHNYRIYRYE